MNRRVPIGVSNKHIHLSKDDLEFLFGEDYELTPIKMLKQPGQFACEEMVTVRGPKGSFKVRVLGPERKHTQLEIDTADAFTLGVRDVPIRLSGDIEGTPGFTIEANGKKIYKDKGMIIAERHIHLSEDQGRAFGINNGERVSVRIKGPRGLVFNNVLCRVGDGHEAEMHLDIEEANASGARNDQLACIIDPISFTKEDILVQHQTGEVVPMVGDLPFMDDEG